MHKLGTWVLVLIVSAPLAARAAEQQGAPKRITPVVLPLWSEGPVGRELGFGIADKAGALLEATGDYNHVHLKQVLNLVRGHDWRLKQLTEPELAKRAIWLLGAQLGLGGSLRSRADGGFELTFSVYDLRTGKQSSGQAALPAGVAAAVDQGALALAAAIAELDGVKLAAQAKVHPDTRVDGAMQAYLACAAVLIEQPMGLRKSHVVDPARMSGARQQCQRAVRLDPEFSAAWATLSLANSLALQSEEAARALEAARKAEGYLAFKTLAHYWLATRFGSNAEGAKVLDEAIAARPGALIFRTYLGEHLNVTRQYDRALQVWRGYLDQVARSPYAQAQEGYSLARLGKLNHAVTLTRAASGGDPDSLDLKLELASRLVDAGKLSEAEQLLLPMAEHPRAFGEILLRLGYVYLLQRKDDQAEPWLRRALEKARGPNEWRTRGRTRYDLAILEARRGKLAEAEEHLLAAAAEGFLVRDLLQKDADLKVLAPREKVAHLFKSPSLKIDALLHATPFPVDSAGQVDPDAERKKITGFTF